MSTDKPSSPGLLRGLGLLDATTLVVGCIIGAGIFRLSGRVAEHSAGAPFIFFLAWALAGLLSLTGALCYAELAALFPKTGGDYVFLTNAYGRIWGFLFGWTKVFVQRTGTIAIVALIFAEHACRVAGWDGAWVRALATGLIILLTAANIAGLTVGKTIQNVFTGLKVLALGTIIVVGIGHAGGDVGNFQPFFPADWNWSLVSATGVAMIFAVWTFGGFTEAAYVAEEVKNPGRNLPLAIIGGLLAVTALYILVNFVYLYYLPLDVMARPEMRLTAAATMDKIWSGRGGQVVAAMVMISTMGAVNGFILTGGRILLALARDHALFQNLAGVNPKTHTPSVALLFNAAIATALIWTGRLDQIVTYTEIVISIFFMMTGVSVFIFRRRMPDAPRAYKVWFYPWTPAAFILMYLAFVVNAVIEQPKESIFGIAFAFLGVPLYLLSERLGRRPGAA